MEKRESFAVFFLAATLLTAQAHAQTLGSCKIFPPNNPWNERVDSLPVHWNSAKYIANVGGTIHIHPDFGSDPSYGIPWVAVGNSQAFVPVDITGYVDESDPGPMPIPPDAPIESDGDSHVLVVDSGNHKLYELYQGVPGANGWSATSTAIFALDSNNYRPDGWTSCDAAGLPIWPGLVKKYECDLGEIKHALRFTIQHTQKAWIFPARHEAGSTTDTTVMPMGLRLRLKANFNDSNFTGYAKVIATAIKRYGIILADNGSNWYISGETNTSWPDSDINQLKQITGNDFEVVYTGPVRTQPNQYPDPVLPPPQTAAISAPAIVYDTARVGDINQATFQISNAGTSPDTIGRYWLKSGSVFQIADSATHTLAPGAHALIAINFLPFIDGAALDTLFVAPNDTSEPATAIPLDGFGTEGVFALSQNPLQFGSVPVGSSDTMIVALSNSGDGELDVNVANTQGSNSDFTIIGIGPQAAPPFALQPGDSELAEFLFTPSSVGPDTSFYSLAFADTLGEEYDTILVLAGVGTAPSLVTKLKPEPFTVTVFPNPAAATVCVRPSNAEPTALRLFNIGGELVWQGWSKSETTMLDLSGFANGTYVLRAQSSKGSATVRLVIAK